MRTTDREVYAALMRYLATINEGRENGARIGIVRDSRMKDWGTFLKTAEKLAVPVVDYMDKERPRMGVERVPACYGGGVRLFLCSPGSTGHDTIQWWPSAGLGPSRQDRTTAVNIIGAARWGHREGRESSTV